MPLFSTEEIELLIFNLSLQEKLTLLLLFKTFQDL